MQKNSSDFTRRAWKILRLALLWAREGGLFRKRLAINLNTLPKYIKSLRHVGRSGDQLIYGERELSFDATPIIHVKMYRPSSWRFKMPHIPCISNPQRLARLGVPEENLSRGSRGLVAYVKNDKSQISELVSAILPAGEEATEAVSETRRGVFGAVWGNDDLAYRCRTCEHDSTCAICVPCFENGNHKDRDYSVIHRGGGSCDSGDTKAWKREVFEACFGFLTYLLERKINAEITFKGSPRPVTHVAGLPKAANNLTSAMVEML
ncbi:E3 ubiquitin- ligase PRT6 [Olea europaea subsp. europaea]|uniref:E3 ubiquitin-protein ligase n=1 Tax=Olea europaea subsp. europaea TaxID=158383 RepID=A0A8S0S1X0_OLEEU|nr:E3 ubiquitin- ligase PRT6 [Olea europaea subsp. europaea]